MAASYLFVLVVLDVPDYETEWSLNFDKDSLYLHSLYFLVEDLKNTVGFVHLES